MSDLKKLIERIKSAAKQDDWQKGIKLSRTALDRIQPSQKREWYAVNLHLAIFLLEEKPGTESHIKEAEEIYHKLLESVSKEKESLKWAQLHRNLAYVYDRKGSGEKGQNIDKAIQHYRQALSVFSKNEHPEDFAIVSDCLGLAYEERISGDLHLNLQEAKRCFSNVLAVFTEEKLPEDRQNTLAHLERVNSKLKMIGSGSGHVSLGKQP